MYNYKTKISLLDFLSEINQAVIKITNKQGDKWDLCET